jgi:hypothetical protein
MSVSCKAGCNNSRTSKNRGAGLVNFTHWFGTPLVFTADNDSHPTGKHVTQPSFHLVNKLFDIPQSQYAIVTGGYPGATVG